MKHLFPIIVLWVLGALSTAHALTGEGLNSSAADVDRIIAVVNEDVITQSELDTQLRVVQEQLAARNEEIPPSDILHRQLLERMVITKLQLQLAETTGIRVDDDTLNRGIENIAAQNKLSLGQFRDVLERDGFDFSVFRENIRNEITITRLRQRQVSNRLIVTDQEINNFLATEALQSAGSEGGAAEEYHVAQILIGLPEAATPEQIQNAQREAEQVLAKLRGGADFKQTAIAISDDQQALEGGDLGWRAAPQLPTLIADVVPAMKPGDISAPIRSPSGFHIIALLDRRDADGVRIVKQTQVRHILVRTDELTSDEDARTRLEQLKQRIEGGDDFANLARSNSDDATSAVNGGSLGWVNPGDLVARFEEAMAELASGTVSEPFQTQFGWHIAQVTDRRDHDNTDESKRAQARESIRQRKTEEEIQTWLRSVRDEAYVEYKADE